MGTGGPPETCSLITSTIPQMSQISKESVSWTAGMSTRAVARELHVHFSAMGTSPKTFHRSSNQPYNRRPGVTTQARDLPHPACSPSSSSESGHPDSCNNRFADPKKNCCTNCQKPSRWKLTCMLVWVLTGPIRRRSQLEWANTHI